MRLSKRIIFTKVRFIMKKMILSSLLFLSACSTQVMSQATIPMPVKKEIKVDQPANIMEQAILDRHNYYRQIAGEKFLFWNNDVAQNAYKWAKKLQKQQCTMKHSSQKMRSNIGDFNYLGENLSLSIANYPQEINQKTLTKAVDGWYNEIANYQYDRQGDFDSCPIRNNVSRGQTGHFTQVMWENTQALGCAAVQCDGNQKVLIVCQYGEGGNYVGQQAFSEKVRQNLNNAEINKKIGGVPVCRE